MRARGKTSHGQRDNPSVGAAKYFNFRRMETPGSLASSALTHPLRGTRKKKHINRITDFAIAAAKAWPGG